MIVINNDTILLVVVVIFIALIILQSVTNMKHVDARTKEATVSDVAQVDDVLVAVDHDQIDPPTMDPKMAHLHYGADNQKEEVFYEDLSPEERAYMGFKKGMYIPTADEVERANKRMRGEK